MPLPDFAAATREIEDLVALYDRNRADSLRSSSTYNETDTRSELIDPLFAALGWDIANRGAKPNRLREVIRETRVMVDENTKRPDYEFRLGAERRFFVEVKRPSVDILATPKPAFQVRRYGWSAGLMVSILTNFENLVIYDTTTEPQETHAPDHSRLHRFHYTEYVPRLAEIARLLSREVVYSGDFDINFASTTRPRPAEKIDSVFLDQLNRWRLSLSQDLYAQDPAISDKSLNEVSQRLILRILFLRMCEDRGIQTYERLRQVAVMNDWDEFTRYLVECDQRYDSGLFDTTDDPFCTGQDRLRLDTATVLNIIDSLYFPSAPYTFSVIEPEFLGSIYEQFLTEKVQVEAGQTVLARKPEHHDRDLVSTPHPIIKKVVEDTISGVLEGLGAGEILGKRVADPATGSGGFLIAAFDLLIDAVTAAYQREGRAGVVYQTDNGPQLIFEEKVRVLTGCLFGADRDYLAVEVARFSLLVKLLENETAASLPARDRLLPSLGANVVFGDSLIDDRIYDLRRDPATVGPPLTWGTQLPDKYDFVIGNPPYLKTEDMVNLEPTEHEFYTKFYRTAWRQFDKYYLFIERAIRDLLLPNGILGMIVSRKFSHIESGKPLRRLLSGSYKPYRLIDFGTAQLFEGRTTYTCLLFAKAIESEDEPLSYALVSSPKEWIAKQQDSDLMRLPRWLVSGDKSWVLPSTPQELQLLEALLRNSTPLGEMMEVFNGIQTSCNDVYVIKGGNRILDGFVSFTRNGRTWRIEEAVIKPFFEDDRREPLKSFHPLPPVLPLLFPYTISIVDGELRATCIPPDTFRVNYPEAWAWIEHNREVLQRRDIRPANYPPNEWYRYGRDQALTAFEDRPKIVVGVNSQGDKYVYDETNTLLASGGTAGECAIAAFSDEERRSPYSLYFILALLNHKAVEYFCRKRGSPFRGGWYARGTAVLKEVPVPNIDFATTNDRRSLYEEVTEMSQHLCAGYVDLRGLRGSAKETVERRLQAVKQRMDRMISDLYGVADIIDSVELPA